MVFLTYLVEQILPEKVSIKIDSNYFYIMNNGCSYIEEIFDPKTALFTAEDITNLQEICDVINRSADVISLPEIGNIKLLKNWYLLTHEKYFKQNPVYDKYGRLGFDNVCEPFQEILKIPIADVLRKILKLKLNINKISKPRIYLTCDYDMLNIWDSWTFFNLIKSNIKLILKIDFKKIINNISSYFFSRRHLKYNGYLNDNMFDYSDNNHIYNIAFFISKPANRKYDGKIEYTNKTVDQFIKKLKNNDVIFGLHTNFDTCNNPQELKKQVNEFKNLFNVQPLFNRHHYLRFRFPEYLEILELNGIKCDFSLYFPENTSFRTGTCSKYKVWNINKQRPYETEVIPITLMDGTFSDYIKCTEQEAFNLAVKKINLAVNYCDSIVLLWHNHSVFKYSHIADNYHPLLYNKIINILKARML